MNLQVLGSSSKGNCYILSNENEALIIEAGVSIQEVKKALNFELSKVAGCLISHEHGDHAKSTKKFIEAGIDIYSSRGTIEALGVSGHRVHNLVPEALFHIGPFKVLPFPVVHDCAEPFGFLISHPECGKVLFVTDTGYLEYTFKGLNNLIIEVNYSDEILEENVRAGRMPGIAKKHVIGSHMELNVLLGILEANDLSQVNKIVLIHLSDGNSNAEQFHEAVEKATGKNVFIAEPGLDIHFNTTPF